ncbi:hypothetical protein [Falsiroseomonas tokyonensis]|uniref:Uncharacterized protein n=1 Tax=Falsiroseomonas tokyonensis TaxID=430521 RepID=A0ABV7BVU3_9PROT|nr:hypothetical protein [Falsiroseomonas tokyonensis]MBU8538727.1 hypothetical protein [Falsiroseomonas tokyonensis]
MTTAPTRRGLLAAAPALLFTPAALAEAPAALPEADARLLALRTAARAALERQEAAFRQWTKAEGARDRAAMAAADADQQEHWEAYVDTLLEMTEIPAAGLVGLAAKMSATAAFADAEGGQNDEEFQMLASAAEDAARLLGYLAQPGGEA